MLLTITTTAEPGAAPADELGYLLHENPARVQAFDLPVGRPGDCSSRWAGS